MVVAHSPRTRPRPWHLLPYLRRSRRLLMALLVLLIALVVLGLWRFTRNPPLRPLTVLDLSATAPTDSATTLRMVELYTGTSVVGGNRVQLLLNGDELYPPLWRDLRSARSTITIQSYYAFPGAVADTLRVVLTERARAGVKVLVLLDAFGSQDLTRDWRTDLQQAGVNIAILRALNWSTLHNAANRSHVRSVVIDGRVGYTGGFGFADHWLGDGRHDEGWRESNVRVEGPAVAQLQATFAIGWVEATGEFLNGPAFYPPPTQAGGVAAGVFFSRPTLGNTQAERFLTVMMIGATRRLYITNSYFVPNADFRRLLEQAVARGVDVRVLTAGPTTDVRTARLAGRFHYDELLAAGVRIYEYQPTMMHAKTMVIDSRWSAVGSMNFDNRSLAYNDEANLLVADSGIGVQMDSAFAEDLKRSVEITPATWSRRSVAEKAMELGAVLLSRVL
jgi:cardiolipin synthase